MCYKRCQPEWVSYRAHAQHHVEVGAHPLNEVGEHAFGRVLDPVPLGDLRQLGADLLELVRLVEVGHLAARQDVVDVFEEGLVDDLRVVEEEDGGLVLHAGRPVQTLQIYKKIARGGFK